MSLPDTVFIFVLALIIFGPKKLPEIGRQLGKLVGEFRRASNEFKFQIEEELRQADWNEKRSSQAPAGAATLDTSRAMDALSSPAFPGTTPDDGAEPSAGSAHDPAELLPVGQHPNIDSLDPAGSLPDVSARAETKVQPVEVEEVAIAAEIPAGAAPVVAPAEGTQPRTRAPRTQEPAPPGGAEAVASAPVALAEASSRPALDPGPPAETPPALQETETAHG